MQDCTVSGAASDLYLWLWNRAPATEPVVAGDRALLRLWREGAGVTWS